MKMLDIKDQVRLPLSKCFELVLSGVKFRLFRAAVTVTIISLAGAFLMTMLSESLMARRVANAIDQRTAPRETFRKWVDHLTTRLSEGKLNRQLANLQSDSPHWRDMLVWSGLSDGQLAQLADVARRQAEYTTYFESLSPGLRRRLIGRETGSAILESLQSPQRFGDFKLRLKDSDKQIGDLDEFETFLADWYETKLMRKAIRTGHYQAMTAFRETLLKGQTATTLLANIDDDLRSQFKTLGFEMSDQDARYVTEQASLALDVEVMARLLNQPVANPPSLPEGVKATQRKAPLLKNVLGGRAGVSSMDVTTRTLFKATDSRDGAQWFVDLTGCDTKQGRQLSTEQVMLVARVSLEQLSLNKIEASVSRSSTDSGFMGFSTRAIWLILVSFLVCIVGIANAMSKASSVAS